MIPGARWQVLLRGPRLAGWLTLLALAATASAPRAQALVSAEVRAEAARLFRELAALRGHPAPGPPPPLVVRGREDRRRFVAEEIARKYAPARLEAERRALAAWGLVPPGFDLAGFLADLLAEQAAAYYDPVAKRMILANWLTPELRREALAHELVHALQDRVLGLDRFLAAVPGRSDAALARQALIEGEAVALAYDLRLRAEGRELASLPDVATLQRAIRTSATGPVLARAPRYLREALVFPYAAGLGFVHAVRQRRPWRDLDAVYRDPPTSTAQILHPARYLDRREDPARIELPDLGPVLPPGAARLIEDELGELGVGEVLRQFLGESAAAQGWRGDRYALWHVAGEPPLLVAVTAWQDDAQAMAFARAYATVLARKHGLPLPADVDEASWTAGSRAYALDRLGSVVLLAEGAPAPALAAVRAVLRGTPVLH